MTLQEYFNGDELAADVWPSKYAMKGEVTPRDMHIRIAREFDRNERKYVQTPGLLPEIVEKLSEFGKKLPIVDEIMVMKYLDHFKYIVPQGSIMTMLGNTEKIGSLSNCFVVPPPVDSYGGIMRTDEHLVQLMKRRGGVGTNINTLRPSDTPVSNAAGTSTGAVSFMSRYSNTTREVAQNGRRGALMLLISCQHPDIFKFVNVKKDRTQVTGANISVMLTDEFMRAVEREGDYLCRFPVTDETPYFSDYGYMLDVMAYNTLLTLDNTPDMKYVMKIRAKELFDMIVENAWENAEPGLAYMDRVHNYSPDAVYPEMKSIASNPCGEQWMPAYDACRLLALNLFSIIKNPFTPEAEIDFEKLYEIAYVQQRLADDIVDLEVEHVERIIAKIKADKEDASIKAVELDLWENVKKTALASRRTGCGFTGLGDMLAALNIKYDSDEAIKVIDSVMSKKMEAELDCTIDLAILRGSFAGWSHIAEYASDKNDEYRGNNDFYQFIWENYTTQFHRMKKYGRRNLNWSTVAPTGTVSIMTQTTGGLEPLFLPFYMRRKKINPSDKGSRVDFTDQNGDTWQEFPILHQKFKDWLKLKIIDPRMMTGTDEELSRFVDGFNKEQLQNYFEESPWFGSTANDISWEKRIRIQSVIQKYTTNAISSTINLPTDVSKETVTGIYMAAWKEGLKGVTIYRDGCRSGVLVSDSKKSSFDYSDAVKRPKDIDGNLHVVTVKGNKYGVIIGIMDGKPYELFAFDLPPELKESCNGKIVKAKKGQYNFVCDDGTLKNLQEAAVKSDELVLTRLVSGMLRHGAKPQFVMEQIDKCDLEIVSFGKAISRVLKKYVKDEEMVARNKCKDCGSTHVKMQEGCLTCLDCGSSKCG